MINFIKSFFIALLPERCAYCGKVIPSGKFSCSKCENELPRIEGTTCRKCGREKDKCSCKGSEKYFSSLCAPFYFEGCVRKGVHVFKFRKGYQNHKAYAEEMAKTVKERLSNINFDYITEVPMFLDSERERGYNQSSLIAQKMSEILNLEHKSSVLVKIFKTNNQHKISYYLRKGNLIGVFDVPNPEEVKGKTILLCDDISTTGETFNECAKMLWLYGAKEVHCISLALTPPKKDKHIH